MPKRYVGPQVHTRLDAKQIEKVVKLLRETDMTLLAISTRMGVSLGVISDLNKKHGVRNYNKNSTQSSNSWN